MRKTACTILLAILVLQPVVLVSTSILGHGITKSETQRFFAQDAGSRLEPHEYTDHVPVLIDDPGDWTDQGWPGAGTTGDPYVIAGLRIQFDIGVPLITIHNQDVYFIIRDCLLIQNSTSYAAIEIENTTHARVEYTTVYSEYFGLLLTRANNTVMDHVFAENDNVFASNVILYGSLLCEISNSEFRSLGEVALILDECNNATVMDSTLYGYDGGMWSFLSNYSLFEDLEISSDNSGFDGMYSANCIYSVYRRVNAEGDYTGFQGVGLHSLIVEDCSFLGDDFGLYMWPSNDVSISGTHFESGAGRGAYLEDCHYASFSGNTITNTDLASVWWHGGENGSITGNTIEDSNSHGIHVEATFNVMVSENSLEDVWLNGVLIDNSDNVTLFDNSYLRAGSLPYSSIHILNSDYSKLTSEHVEEPVSACISVAGSHNGLIDDCWGVGDPKKGSSVFFGNIKDLIR